MDLPGTIVHIVEGLTWTHYHKNVLVFRDPNISSTLDVIEQSLGWIRSGSYNDSDIAESKISVFSEVDNNWLKLMCNFLSSRQLDAPKAPGEKGLLSFLRRIPISQRQQFRNNLFQVTKEDLVKVGEKWVLAWINFLSSFVMNYSASGILTSVNPTLLLLEEGTMTAWLWKRTGTSLFCNFVHNLFFMAVAMNKFMHSIMTICLFLFSTACGEPKEWAWFWG